MGSASKDAFGCRAPFETAKGRARIYRLDSLEKRGVARLSRLPFSIKILLESLLRNFDGSVVTEDHILALARWHARSPAASEVPFKPARVILQDFTGVPAVVDLAAYARGDEAVGR